MKKFACAFVGLLSTTGFAAAQQALTWQGSATITQLAGAGCSASEGLSAGDLSTAIYRPTIGASGPSRLQLVVSRGAALYEKTGAGQMNGAGSYSGTRLGGRASAKTFTGKFNFKSTPAVVVASTPVVTLTGTITNFDDTTGCTAKISATFSKRPD